MTDIVDRLRQGVDIDYATGSFGDTEKVMEEAADEIERLRAKALLLDKLMHHFYHDSDGITWGIQEDLPIGSVDAPLQRELLKEYYPHDRRS